MGRAGHWLDVTSPGSRVSLLGVQVPWLSSVARRTRLAPASHQPWHHHALIAGRGAEPLVIGMTRIPVIENPQYFRPGTQLSTSQTHVSTAGESCPSWNWEGGMAVDHVGGGSRTFWGDLPPANFPLSKRDPPSLSKNSMNSLGKGCHRTEAPGGGRAWGRGRGISLEAGGPAPPGEGLPVRRGHTGTAGCICRQLACVCRNLPGLPPQGLSGPPPTSQDVKGGKGGEFLWNGNISPAAPPVP